MKIKILLFFSLAVAGYHNCLQAGPAIKAELGPGWNYGHTFLLPSTHTEDQGLLTTSNDLILWNPYVYMALEGTYKFRRPWFVSAYLGGALMRHGRGVITDSDQTHVFSVVVGNSVDDHVIVQFNDFDVKVWGGYTFSLAKHLTFTPYGGYYFAKGLETIFFLSRPLIFYKKAHYKGPYVGASLKVALESVSFAFTYQAIIGALFARKTQSTNNTFVLRTVPDMINNLFSFECSYKLREDLILSEKVIYTNNHNHALGRSRTYVDNVLTVNVKNVLSTATKNLRVLTTLEYEF